MAVDGFRPTIWSAEILVALRDKLVYGGLCNRNYEGLIQNAGDTVKVTSIGDPAVRSYSEHGTITWDELADSQQSLLIDQADYFAFKVDDIEAAQNIDGFVEEASRGAAFNLAVEVDSYVSSIMYTAVNGGANDLGSKTADISDNSAYGILVDLRTKLVASNTPMDGRWVVVPPELYAALLQDNRFIDASASGSTDALRSGFVGRAAGFDVFESNTVPVETAGVWSVIAGHPIACTFADQIAKTEALRIEDSFEDGIRGLHVYGSKVLRPECLALASVSVQA